MKQDIAKELFFEGRHFARHSLTAEQSVERARKGERPEKNNSSAMSNVKMRHRAVILDRDGTLVRDSHYLNDPKKIHIYKGVVPALKKLKEKGWKIIIGTNQSGIGRGYFTLKKLEKIHAELLKIFRKNNLHIDEIYFCPHHPDDRCHCRKPNLGMLKAAAKKQNLDLARSIVIGDKECDIQWGKNARAATILVLTGKGRKHRRLLKSPPDHISNTLPNAVNWILKNE